MIREFFQCLIGRAELDLDFNSQVRYMLQRFGVEGEAEPRSTIRERAQPIKQVCKIRRLTEKQRDKVELLSKERGYRPIRCDLKRK